MFKHLRSDRDALPQPPETVEACDCERDPAEALKTMFVDIFQGSGLRGGRDPATRPVFLRLQGAASGRLTVEVRIWRSIPGMR